MSGMSGRSGSPPYDSQTALVLVDVQNDFADPAGSLSVRGGEGVVANVNGEIARAVEADALVVATQDWHPISTPHFVTDGGPWPVHCVAETWGAALHPALELPVDAPRVRKGRGGEDGYSGFTMRDPSTGEERPTELDTLLRSRGVARVRIAGLATDYCVRATALDAVRLGYDTTLLTAAVAAVNLDPGDGERALAEMAEAGVRLD
jgi:nicotinamidase/pyrazinamidase